jgi:hypothetical protein
MWSALELPPRTSGRCRPFLKDREKQVERCAFADSAVHTNEAADLLRQCDMAAVSFAESMPARVWFLNSRSWDAPGFQKRRAHLISG